MAREIHDGVGHYLTVIHMQIQAARAVLASDPARANHTLESAQNMTQEALVDIRRSVTALRSSPEDNLTLPERINRLVQNLPAIQIHGEFTLNGSPRSLPPQVELTLYRAAQEGINNACKHAHAAHLWLSLDYSQPGEVFLDVRDDGVGAADPTGGFGLVGLRERVLLLNGSLQINSSEGQGFSLNIRLPG